MPKRLYALRRIPRPHMVVLHITEDETIALGVPNRAFCKAEAGGQSLDRSITYDNVLEAFVPNVKNLLYQWIARLASKAPPEVIQSSRSHGQQS